MTLLSVWLLCAVQAGSERVGKTGTTGNRLTEAKVGGGDSDCLLLLHTEIFVR